MVKKASNICSTIDLFIISDIIDIPIGELYSNIMKKFNLQPISGWTDRLRRGRERENTWCIREGIIVYDQVVIYRFGRGQGLLKYDIIYIANNPYQ